MTEPESRPASDQPAAAGKIDRQQRIPVSVVLERRIVRRSFWSRPAWRLQGVLVGQQLGHEPAAGGAMLRTPVGLQTTESAPGSTDTDSGQMFLWDGLRVTLYRDACERYWHSLIGDQPRVHVICHEVEAPATDPAGAGDASGTVLRPVKVTVNYDEAIAYGDTDQQVLSAPIPAELYRHMEAFVLTHYQPREIRKRKRRDWHAESDLASAGRTRPGSEPRS